MNKFGRILQLAVCLSLVVIAVCVPGSSQTQAAGPPSGLSVDVVNTPLPVQGTVNVGNLPATQSVSGNISVSNFPTTQAVTGTVNIGNFPASSTVTGSVGITGTPNVNVANTPTVNVGNAPKPSQFFHLASKQLVCPGDADHSHGIPFTFPTGQVAVITSASFSSIGGVDTSGHEASFGMFVGTNDFVTANIPFDSNGGATWAITFPTGIVVHSSELLCVNLFVWDTGQVPPFASYVNGYFTTDQ